MGEAELPLCSVLFPTIGLLSWKFLWRASRESESTTISSQTPSDYTEPGLGSPVSLAKRRLDLTEAWICQFKD